MSRRFSHLRLTASILCLGALCACTTLPSPGISPRLASPPPNLMTPPLTLQPLKPPSSSQPTTAPVPKTPPG